MASAVGRSLSAAEPHILARLGGGSGRVCAQTTWSQQPRNIKPAKKDQARRGSQEERGQSGESLEDIDNKRGFVRKVLFQFSETGNLKQVFDHFIKIIG